MKPRFKRRYADNFEFVPIGFFTLGSEGRILEIDPTAARLLEADRSGLINEKFTQFITDGFQAVFQHHCKKALESGKRETYDLQLLKANRSVFWAQLESIAVVAGDSALNGRQINTAITDITDRKQAEDALCKALESLEHSEERFRSVVETAIDAIVTVDSSGRIIFWNHQAEVMFGYKAAEVIGQPVAMIMPERFREAHQRGLIQAASCKKHKITGNILELVGLRKDICEFPLELSLANWETKEGIFFTAIVRDISERKQAEKELKAARDELEQRVNERTAELGKTNTQLRKQISECEMARLALRESDKELRVLSNQLLSAEEKERKRIARELHDGIGQALSAIKFSIENALLQLRTAANPIDLGALEAVIPLTQKTIEEVRRIVKDLRPSILDDLGILATIRWFCREFQNVYSAIRIETTIGVEENDVSPYLKTTIYRIMQEALNNVAKHSRANFVRLQLKKNESHLNLSIHDNGRGFDLDRAMALSPSCRGFGLASMRERAELSGASFRIDAAPGKGTRIRIAWPC